MHITYKCCDSLSSINIVLESLQRTISMYLYSLIYIWQRVKFPSHFKILASFIVNLFFIIAEKHCSSELNNLGKTKPYFTIISFNLHIK